MRPGIYPGLSMDQYLAASAVSASLLLTLLERCPYAAWHDSWMNPKPPAAKSTDEQDVGTLAHALLLEGTTAGMVQVFKPEEYPNEKGGGHASGWTNKAIKAARDAAIAEGRIPVLVESMDRIEGMNTAARAYIESLRTTEPAVWAAFQEAGGQSELTLVWDEDEVRCRARPDRIALDHHVIVDYKTTKRSAEPGGWGRTQMSGMGYYISASLYRRGVRALCGVTPDYLWLVQEQDPPYLCSLVGMSSMTCEIGEARIATALRAWAECMRTGKWLAYPNRAAYPELPAWEIVKSGAEIPSGIPYDPSQLFERRDLDALVDALPER